MRRNKDQGTDLERQVVNDFLGLAILAMGLKTGGQYDKGDVWLNKPPVTLGRRIAVLVWKRLVGDPPRRRPDGERTVMVFDYETGKELLRHYLASKGTEDVQVVIQCKAAQALSVTRTLFDAKKKAGHTGLNYTGLGTE